MKKLKKQAKATKILVVMVLMGIFVVLASVSSVSAASTVYVNATGGNDANLGTIGSPYQTIGKGIRSVDENGIVHIADGNYSGAGNTRLVISQSMTIVGQSQKKTIINGTGTDYIFYVMAPDVTIANLTFTNATSDNGGAICNYGTNLNVLNCTFTDNKAHLVVLSTMIGVVILIV